MTTRTVQAQVFVFFLALQFPIETVENPFTVLEIPVVRRQHTSGVSALLQEHDPASHYGITTRYPMVTQSGRGTNPRPRDPPDHIRTRGLPS